jgi:hypothetical protein
MISKVIVTASAVFLLALGVGLDFLPQEASARLGLGTAPMAALLFQVLAAAFLGMGFQNWFSKANPMGGIYSRPLALQNFLCFGVAAITLDRAVFHGGVPKAILAAAIVFSTFALAFGWLMFFHDPIGKLREGSSTA